MRTCLLCCAVVGAAFPTTTSLLAQSAVERTSVKVATASAEVPAEATAKIEIRLLDVRGSGSGRDFYLSGDGSHAVALETTTAGQQRYALWDIPAGKLVRFLSANQGQETKAYAGNDSADFGAEVDFPANDARKFAFSTDGKLVAALTELRGAGIPGVELKDEIVVWQCATGKLLRRVFTTHHHPYTFLFLDEKNLIAKGFSKDGVAIEMIDATTGELSHLLKPDRFEMYGGAIFGSEVVFACPGARILSVDLETREPVYYKAPPAGAMNLACERMWFSKDGKRIFLHKGRAIEIWDAERQSYLREWSLEEVKPSNDILNIATEAGLVAVKRSATQQLDFLDVEQGQVRSTFTAPWERMELSGISRDGKRVIIPAGERRVAAFYFPDGIPPGELVVKPLMKDVDKKGSR